MNAQTPEEKLAQAGLKLPPFSAPIANYVKYVRSGNLVFLSGHGPAEPFKRGKLGRDLTVEEGYAAARNTALNLISTLKEAVGDLSKVQRVVKVLGMVNATEEFTDHPKVVNGFSDLITEVFGEKGKHARSAVGMQSLPGNIPVEIEMIVEVSP